MSNPIDKALASLNAYIQHKQDSVRNAAYETSKKTKEVRVPLIKLTKEEIGQLEQEFESNNIQMQRYLASKSRPLWVISQEDPFNKTRNDAWYNATLERNRKIAEILKSGCKEGSSCTNHSTGHYGPKYQMASSEMFVTTNGKGAFEEVPKSESKAGDVVISFRDMGGYWAPHHTLMFSKWDEKGSPRYNASNGGSTPDALRWNQLYNTTDSTRTYRFKGDSKDIEQWTKEYNNE